jgi:exodeoxyribonuclease VII small subunit
MAKKAETTFEEDIEALDEIVQDLEGGELGLDDSLKRFEDGVALARKLRARLDAAQGRIEELLESGDVKRLDVE